MTDLPIQAYYRRIRRQHEKHAVTIVAITNRAAII
jgi:hypothetical protein